MTYFAVLYTYITDAEAVSAVRPEHRQFLAGLKEKGMLVGSGPLKETNPGEALIVLALSEGATVADAEAVMDDDPFNRWNRIANRRIVAWDPVLRIF
ncbi:YciI family protein [Corynebacterium pyruviciproducens]|uniref:YciI family protein n=1 Tax=Corynebacterium pyruviciproducens TaxID=598660 RepID=A0AAF1BZV6_9CORY|nr:YciI family protein [Corynebacterium pyruviciproducens]WOT03110.1 YciI family protein [Corynebacterium pyruviciproducens]